MLAVLGAEACWPLADFATSLGLGIKGAVVVVVVDIAELISLMIRWSAALDTFITIDLRIGICNCPGFGEEVFGHGHPP